jgi:hypothetical protein
VPAGHYLLLGDNRDASTDSRSWHNPYVSRDEIVGILIRRRDRMMARQSPHDCALTPVSRQAFVQLATASATKSS